MSAAQTSFEESVLSRYARGAKAVEPALCCPISYDRKWLEALPAEIVEKDYGCGDPTQWAREGDVVLDLGSGSGKACYILAQKVGARGRVIGVDFNDAMLQLARKYQIEMARKLGFANVEFKKGRIQDLALDIEALEGWLADHPVRSAADLVALEAHCDGLRLARPLVANDSVDLVVSNCVLNLVRPEHKTQLFGELHRVLRRGGRAVISDIVCDEDPTPEMVADPELWSGCISGAFREDRFLEMFEQAGFYGVEIATRAAQPWQTVGGIEFRSLTVRAFKGKEGPCLERNQAVVYRGPWNQVRDDDGHVLRRGARTAVCDKTFKIYTDPNGPYAAQVLGVEPLVEIPLEEAGLFECRGTALRHPRETKGAGYDATQAAAGPSSSACAPGGSCC